MKGRECRSIELLVRKRLTEVESEEGFKSLTSALCRIARVKRAFDGDADALIELGEQIWGTKND